MPHSYKALQDQQITSQDYIYRVRMLQGIKGSFCFNPNSQKFSISSHATFGSKSTGSKTGAILVDDWRFSADKNLVSLKLKNSDGSISRTKPDLLPGFLSRRMNRL